MSLLDKASLIVTPNSYKESKLYSVVPNTTLGDMDVVRATTATRVNSLGLIEVVPRNLFQYSEAISTSPWALVRATVSTNSINSPTGTLTADTLVSNITGSDGSWTRQIVSAINGNFNMSIYAKQGTSPFLQVRLDGLGAVIFNLSNGTVKLSSSGIIGSITSVGSDGWYRCSISGTATGQTTALFIVGNSSMNLVTWFATNGDSVYLWGAQVEQGSLTEYFPTTTRLNIPRIDYTNGSCPSLLVEPQRTNLFTYSDQFDNIAWSKFQATVTANNTTSPEGVSTADKLESSTNGTAVLFRTALTGATASTISVYAKAGTNDVLDIGFTNVTDFTVKANLTTGTITSATSGITGTITNVGNGWYRVTATRTMTASGTAFINSATTISGRFIYIWGAQLEVGAYPTSYIPTVASTVTRNADVISKTGISSLIGQTEGTLFSDFNVTNNDLSNDKTIFAVDDNSYYVNIILARILNNNFLNVTFRANSVAITFTNLPTITNGNHKIAIRYGSGFVSIFVDGVFRNTQVWTNSFTASMSQLFIGKNRIEAPYFNDRIKSVQVYKTALSDTECINLTTL